MARQREARFDLSFRPETYFAPMSLERHLINQVDNAVFRQRLEELYREGRHDEIRELFKYGLPDKDAFNQFAVFGPQMLGGNFLPDRPTNAVEVVRMTLDSTTMDVYCIIARKRKNRIFYKAVDEYNGEMLAEPVTRTSVRPLTQGQMVDFLIRTTQLIENFDIHDFFGEDLKGCLEFFTIESPFYPDLQLIAEARVIDAFRARYGHARIERADDDND